MSSTQKNISFYIYSLDILSGSTNFKIFDRDKNVSLAGLILTFILSFGVISYSIIQLIDYCSLTNFTLISMEDNSQEINAIKYIGNDTIALVRFSKVKVDGKGNTYEGDFPDFLKLFKIRVQQANYDSSTLNYTLQYFDMQNCTNVMTNEEVVKFALDPDMINQSVCPPYDKGLKLRWNKYGTTKLFYEILLCNKSEDENCYSEAEINEKIKSDELDNVAFGFIQEYDIINNNNYNNPITPNSILQQKYIYLDVQYTCDAKSKFVYYESDYGMIFTSIKSNNGLRNDGLKCSNQNRENIFDYKTPLATIEYSIDTSYMLTYKRTYEKLTTVVVDITGIARVVFSIGEYVISLLGRNYFSYKIFDKIFSQKYKSKNKERRNKNIQIYNNTISRISSKKNTGKKTINNNMLNSSIIINEANSDNSSGKIIRKCKSVFKKTDNYDYSIILSQYLGYGKRDKIRFSFWDFIWSKFYRTNNNMKIINSCAKLIDNYLALEQIVSNGINIDKLLTLSKSQEFNDIDIFNNNIDDDFKQILKDIKTKKK